MKNPFIIAVISILFFILIFNDFQNPEATTQKEKDRSLITVPVYIHLVDDNTVQYRTNRDVNNIYSLFEQANRIWRQANIRFSVQSIDTLEIDNFEFRSVVLTGNLTPLINDATFEPGKVNGYFARSLDSNGMSFSPQGLFIVADFTTVRDYRTLAHELGHILGLTHVAERKYLMYQGSNGESLSEQEIEFARRNALRVYAEK